MLNHPNLVIAFWTLLAIAVLVVFIWCSTDGRPVDDFKEPEPECKTCGNCRWIDNEYCYLLSLKRKSRSLSCSGWQQSFQGHDPCEWPPEDGPKLGSGGVA